MLRQPVVSMFWSDVQRGVCRLAELLGQRVPAAAAIRLFAGYATELLDQIEPVAADPRALLNATARGAIAHIVYPVTCARIAEVLGILTFSQSRQTTLSASYCHNLRGSATLWATCCSTSPCRRSRALVRQPHLALGTLICTSIHR